MLEDKNIVLQVAEPDKQLADFVESFWMIANHSDVAHEIVILPDGRFDIIFYYSLAAPYQVMQMGLGSQPEQNSILPGTVMFAVSFKLLAMEYLLDMKAAFLLNSAHRLPDDFWGITKNDLNNFDGFCQKVSLRMLALIKPEIDSRKQKLFELIYASKGSFTVKELSEKVFWSSRQINRYFHSQFGISLKAYGNILRFKSSLSHIKMGKLYPEQNFSDQNHFIKEIKKFSGVVPKELSKNQNDRFLLLSALPEE